MERFLVEFFVRGVVLCLLTALTLILLRRAAAAYRHLLCVLSLCGLLALPLAQRALPPLRMLSPRPASASSHFRTSSPTPFVGSPGDEAAASLSPLSPSSPFPSITAPESLPAQNTLITAHAASIPAPKHTWNLSALLQLVWALGAATLLIRLVVALYRLQRLKAESREEVLAGIAIRVGEHVRTPITWGLRKHTILLPAALLTGDPAVCETAIRHEQAHIARGDWAWNLLAEIVCICCWFQPGTWWLRHRMRLESERACDDRVLLSGIEGPDYAAHLLQILRCMRTSEIAPAMAHSGGIEERMRHILDTNKPRRARTIWMAASAPCALALLSCAALRVSARQADTNATINQGTFLHSEVPATMPNVTSSQLARTVTAEQPSSEFPTLSFRSDLTGTVPDVLNSAGQPEMAIAQGATQATAADLGERVVWSKGVDGLETGFLLTSPGASGNQRITLPSRMVYQVLVRNATRRERLIMVQCQNFEGMSPSLIPNGEMQKAFSGPKIPETYGSGDLLDEREVFPAYPVKLAPGEAVVLPETLSLSLGNRDKKEYPRIENVRQGKNWVVQPITVCSLNPAEFAEAQAGEKRITLTLLHPNGTFETYSTTLRAIGADGKRLYAKRSLEIGALNASTPPTAPAATQGDAGNGLRPGAQAGAGPASNATEPSRSVPVVPAGRVVWQKGVDGLETGFLLNIPGSPDHQRASLNSRLAYQILVRNTSRQERAFEVQCYNHDDMVPYVIPGADLRKALSGDKISDNYRAMGLDVLATAFTGYSLKLSPGETVVVPGQMPLSLGDTEKQSYPRFEQIKPGKHWIAQPVKIRSLSAAESAEDLSSISSPYGNGIDLTILTWEGQPAIRRGAKCFRSAGSKNCYARIDLTVGDANEANPTSERQVQWGEKVEGFQLGARIASGSLTFKVGDVITFQAFGRNLTGKATNLSIGNYWKVNYKLQVQTISGKPVYMERDHRNKAMLVAGYQLCSFDNGATQEISKAQLEILSPTQKSDSAANSLGELAESIPLAPGRYRVRLVSWGLFDTHNPEPTSGWIPLEVK